MGDLFEVGATYVFYFYYGNEVSSQQMSGQVVAYDHPIVKIETQGLYHIINCSSSYFIEAILRKPVRDEELGDLVLERDSHGEGQN
ncbi:hypothetical protein D1AOALGA4SA_2878 [Olavius algarvensis Delta 1 endosymbiont]|nr:hypothetical protein D1AOALGA4SA_2878 [Olavius algarvensis Delta 1 endosymbiont]